MKTNKIKIIKGDLVLKKDTEFKTSIMVKGNIRGYYNLKVAGNIDARNIDAWNIDARNISAWDIDAWNIDARNISAWDIICEKRIKKLETSKTLARVFIQNKSKLERKEHDC